MSAKGFQKSFRSLALLAKTGSTSRVFNLGAVSRACGKLPGYAEAPLLRSPALSRALILKHRLRAEDGDVMGALRWRGTATKLILPFEHSDLALGGAALFVGQPGWTDMLAQVAGTGDAKALAHDQRVLEALDELPSLDPFLVREHLRRARLKVADCYFDLPLGERERMESFVAHEVFPLANMVQADAARTQSGAAALARMLLSTRPFERLDPLRETLRLDDGAYAGGVYAWKGFLYYKWLLATLSNPLQEVLTELARLQVQGRQTPEMAALIATSRGRVQSGIISQCMDARELIGRYDEAFADLTQKGESRGFREFLLASPTLFLELGERIGVLSHIASFWRFCFPVDLPPTARAEDAIDLLQEFEVNLAQAPLHADVA